MHASSDSQIIQCHHSILGYFLFLFLSLTLSLVFQINSAYRLVFQINYAYSNDAICLYVAR